MKEALMSLQTFSDSYLQSLINEGRSRESQRTYSDLFCAFIEGYTFKCILAVGLISWAFVAFHVISTHRAVINAYFSGI